MTHLADTQEPTRVKPMQPALYQLTEHARETKNSVTITLAPLGDPVPQGMPGQFNMLWAWGLGEIPISISAVPSPDVIVHTIREVGAVSHALCAAKPGTAIGVRGPFGNTWPVDDARGHDVVIVAGGIGMAPLRPVIHAILADRSAFGDVTLVVGARHAKDLLFRGELDGWWRSQSIRVRTIVDESTPDWRGNVGIVTQELRRVTVDPERTVAMVCGPEIMMRFVANHLIDEGVDPERIAVSMERNMQCGIGQCGHCQLAGDFVCTDGPVYTWQSALPLMEVREL